MAATRIAAICALLLLASPGILGLGHGIARHLQGSNIPPEDLGRKTKDSGYDPARVDWAGVISACRAIGEYEWRIHNFNIRSCFHDGLAIDSKKHTGGMDGSLFTDKERHESANAGFSIAAYRAIMTVAFKYGTSWADALAVCGAVGVEFLSHERTKIIGVDGYKNFPVGRIDASEATAPDNVDLVKEHLYDDVTRFSKFWLDLDFTVEEGVALIGSHALFDNLGCSKSSVPGDDCNPDKEFCANKIRMFSWDVHYYHSACAQQVHLVKPGPERKGTKKDLDEQIHLAKCQFSSKEYFQDRVNGMVEQYSKGEFKLGGEEVEWHNGDCNKNRAIGVNNHCPHRAPFWPFTVNDAHLARACQGEYPEIGQDYAYEVQQAMRRYLNINEWDRVFVPAFIKMVSKYATWANGKPLYIDGTECPSRNVGYSSYSSYNNNYNSYGYNSNNQNSQQTCPTAWNKDRDHLLPEVEHFVRPAGSEQ